MKPFVINKETISTMFYYTKSIYAYPQQYNKIFIKTINNNNLKQKNIELDLINVQQLQKLGEKHY